MDLATVAAAVLRPGAPVGARDERTAFSLRLLGSLLDGRLRLADVGPDLAREVRAASGDGRATLILPAGPGPARIELAGRQFAIPAALRDALLAALADGGDAGARAMPPGGASRVQPVRDAGATMQLPTQALVAAPGEEPVASAAAANALAASGTLRAARNEAARPAAQRATFDEPLLDPRDAAATAGRLASRVSGTGAFFEAHVAQWLRGDRSAESVRAEARHLGQVAAGDAARAEARSALQLETLQRQAIALAGPAWSGQSIELDLGRDTSPLAEGAGSAGTVEPVFVARLAMDLPRLGAIEVRLRVAGHSIAATIAADAAAQVDEITRALPEFGAALQARGLRPVLLQALPADAAEQS